ncbi:3-beta-glucosidase) (Laminarinase) (SacteLam55A) [Durusdinium trenchii]|uniref:3-beta-glucosidase (Laminarinase (SacteLam55A n=1 Tax=Durusdinium trenchii TaxID=1381693 RepID=A0ABP0ID81_9DINO
MTSAQALAEAAKGLGTWGDNHVEATLYTPGSGTSTEFHRHLDRVPPSRYEPPELEQQMLQASILAYVRSVEVQIETQAPYRRAVITNCKRVAQTLWPRSSLELYGSYASGLGLRTSGLDLLLKVHPSFHGFATSETPEEQAALSPIEEDDEQLRQLKLEEVSPAHSARSVRPLQGWQQQLSDRLAKEKWVVSDSIRVAAHAAIPVLSFAAAPEVKRVSPENELSFMACSTRVDICLHDSGYRGLRSKALINFLLNRFPLARPVTLVLKQWLIEQAYSMSHSGGLCSYGLLLMVIAFLQYSPANTAAAALVGFLNFYGHRFDPQLYGVSVARSAFLPRKSPTSWPPQQAELVERGFLSNPGDNEEAHRFDPLLVEDPVNPTNNVGRNCFRIRQIQRSLARAADLISGEVRTSSVKPRVRGPIVPGVDAERKERRPCEETGLIWGYQAEVSCERMGLIRGQEVPQSGFIENAWTNGVLMGVSKYRQFGLDIYNGVGEPVAYLMQLVRAPTEHEQHLRERRRKLLRHAVGTFVLGALLIQLLLILVAIVIRALDPEEGLVDMMPFFQPKLPDERGFWMAFRYHKSTYYFASVIFCLAVTGLSVLVFTLIRCCVIPRARPAPTCCDMCCWDPCPYNRGYGGPYVYVHGDTRCCVDCCNACCPDSRSSNCMPSSGGGGSSSGNSNNNAAAAIALVLIIILALIGIFFLMAALVTWIQKVWARYMALKELQELTGEYIVQDLAELEKTIGKVDVEQGTAVPGTGDDEVPSAPPLWVPMMPQEVQSNLSRDLQAVYLGVGRGKEIRRLAGMAISPERPAATAPILDRTLLSEISVPLTEVDSRDTNFAGVVNRRFTRVRVTTETGLGEPNPPEWPETVYIYGPEDASERNLTAEIAELLRELNNVSTGHYSSERKALLFKPGSYDVEVEVGYYVQVLGLGRHPKDVSFTSRRGVFSPPMGESPDPGSLDNFWRSAENFHQASSEGMLWAVSQACPLRRVHVDRNLSLFAPKAWASGGFLADVQVDGYTRLGGQQQWIMRNANISTPSASILGGQWNIVLVGCTGTPPETLPSNGAHVALTNVALTPTVAEKPFISVDSAGLFSLEIPIFRVLSVGPSFAEQEMTSSVPFSEVYLARSSDLTSLIQAKLDLGLHVVLSPGIYNLTAPLTLSTADQVLLGIGMATLVAPKDGRPCVYVKGSATGVRVAGLMLQAAASPSVLKVVPVSTLLQWGEPGAVSGDGGDPTKPGVLSDIFARVGGPDVDRSIGVDVVLRIYSNYVGEHGRSRPKHRAHRADGTIDWDLLYELVKERRQDCDYLTYDPPQKKPAFASYEVEHVKISDPDKWFLQMMKPPADSEGKCPEFLEGVFWMRENVANENLVCLECAHWNKEGDMAIKHAFKDWTTGDSWCLGDSGAVDDLARVRKSTDAVGDRGSDRGSWSSVSNGRWSGMIFEPCAGHRSRYWLKRSTQRGSARSARAVLAMGAQLGMLLKTASVGLNCWGFLQGLYAYSALPVEASIPMKFGVFGEVKWCASGWDWLGVKSFAQNWPLHVDAPHSGDQRCQSCPTSGSLFRLGPRMCCEGIEAELTPSANERQCRSWYLIYPGLCLAMGLTPLVGPKGQIPEWVTRPEIFLKIMDFCTDGTCLLTGALMLTIMEQIPKMVKEEQMGLQPSYITMGYLSLLFGTMTTAFWAAKTWAV